MELKRAQLQGEPVRRVGRERHVAQRPADVARRLGAKPGGGHRVRDERRGGGLAVGAGDARRSGSSAERQEADVHLGVDRRRRPRGRRASGGTSGGTPGATTTATARPMRAEVVPAELDRRRRARAAPAAQALVRRAGAAVRGVDGHALAPEQPRRRRRRSSPGPTTATSRPVARQRSNSSTGHAQRTFSVESATRAQNSPRM